jgi:positive phototaxis protein PixI
MQVPQTTKPNARLQQLLPQLFEQDARSGDAFLRVQVTADIAMAIPLSWIEETQLLSPREITAMPNMPPHLLGLMRVKGQVLWLASLAHLLGLATEVERRYRYETIVLRLNTDASGSHTSGASSEADLFLGLAVAKIKGSMRLTPDQLQPIGPQVPTDWRSCLSGQVVQDQETILMLQPETLLSRHQRSTAALVNT